MGYVLHSSSIEAEAINRLHVYFYEAAGFILVTVIAATIFIAIKFKRIDGQEYTPVTLSSRVEYFLVGIPLALVMMFFFLMLNTMHQVQPSADGKIPDVIITGHQFWWEAQYPGQHITAANEIHLPVGRKLLLKLLSADVIHDWWIPEFGSKMDMISGRDNYLWVTIKAPGVYHGACSEFCGTQHAGMNIIVVAQQQNDFNSWLQQHRQPSNPITDSLVQAGAVLFRNKTCGNCHAVKGATADVNTGPDLTHLASRQTLLTGLLQNNRENLSRWIHDPQAIKPGANMPGFLLDKPSIEALTAYLSSLK